MIMFIVLSCPFRRINFLLPWYHIWSHTGCHILSCTAAHILSHIAGHTQWSTDPRIWSHISVHTWSHTAGHTLWSTPARRRWSTPAPGCTHTLWGSLPSGECRRAGRRLRTQMPGLRTCQARPRGRSGPPSKKEPLKNKLKYRHCQVIILSWVERIGHTTKPNRTNPMSEVIWKPFGWLEHL